MKQITLTELLQNTTQDQAAAAMGITQGAVSKMVRKKKNVVISLNDSGEIDHWRYEPEKRFPKELQQRLATG